MSDVECRRFKVTHPYHPFCSQEFELVIHGRSWREDKVWFHDAVGRLHSIPANWTSVVAEEPFNVVACGRALFRTQELLDLARLIGEFMS